MPNETCSHASITPVVNLQGRGAFRLENLTALCELSDDFQNCFIGPVNSWTTFTYIDLHLSLDIPSEHHKRYVHSKLYFTRNSRDDFSETHVICFRVQYLREPQHVRVKLPPGLPFSSGVKFRLDPAQEIPCRYELHGVYLIESDDETGLSRSAELDALKQQTSEGVLLSELIQRAECPHYPESLNLELTPRCNLTCCHCSSHGTPDLHSVHNGMPELSTEVLRKLSAEVFPFLTVVVLVGRGEPFAVTDRLWQTLVDCCVRNRVFMSAVTNASYLRRRMVPAIVPWIDRITISIDGFSRDTFASNRGGDNLERVLQEVADFHDMRKRSSLARRPKLCFSWTLKKNNVAEFPQFAKFAAEMEADGVYVRHLLVYHEKDRCQSLLECQDEAEPYLREAYAILDRSGIPKDCPPLIGHVVPEGSANAVVGDSGAEPVLRPDDRCLYFHKTGVIHSNGDVPTCSAPFAKQVGNISGDFSFHEIWNGTLMTAVRRDFGTDREWPQCRSCWYRELKWHSQRQASNAAQVFDTSRTSFYSIKAWDFQKNIQDQMSKLADRS
jgi:radical SAM protein with 4Fe4S-binding SPASM domain